MMHPWEYPAAIAHAQILLYSFRQWFNQDLLHCDSPGQAAKALYFAPFAVLSHGCEPDPILNYGNQTALTLWEMNWQDFTVMPSRLTAEPELREGRSQLLTQAKQQGYLTDYEGVRISSTGRRFLIRKATIWRVFDEAGQVSGQAATFDNWEPLP
jgi:MEKHLA domain